MKDTLKARWNQEVAFVAMGFRSWGRNVTEWGSELIEKLALPSPPGDSAGALADVQVEAGTKGEQSVPPTPPAP